MRVARLAAAAAVGAFTIWCVEAATPQLPLPAEEREVRATCGTTCHAYPPPDILPRSAWPDTVARMTLLRAGEPEPPPGGRLADRVVLPEDMERVLGFYRQHAPARLPPPAPWPAIDGEDPAFRKRGNAPAGVQGVPAISSVRFLDLDGDRTIEIVATDMRHGLVLRGSPHEGGDGLAVVARVPHPARAELVDVDGDGLRDLLIADLGQFLPGDDEKGAAVWLRRLENGRYESHTFGGFPRVADVRGADFDGDGRLELLVAAFGWRKVGHIAMLRRPGRGFADAHFARSPIDPRSGTLSVQPADLDGDGRLDFIAVISQQHEQVVAFLNRQSGFVPQTIYAAPHPNWGSSGMDVADVDRDGDHDVVLAHGDALDDRIVKPYHGIQWLENRGTYPFTAHALATLPGVHPVKVIDFDGDSDMDVVAATFQPLEGVVGDADMASIVWLEQVDRREFVPHTLEIGSPTHASLDAADFDGDGDVDLAVGNFSGRRPMEAWVEIWENETRSQ